MIERKGLRIAVEATRKAGIKLVMAGQNAKQEGNKVIADDGNIYEGDHLEYVGYADTAKRARLMGEATCLLAPTTYLGPFEGVSIEAQLCGTPAITTDWGCFSETIAHGVAGYRCRTLEQFSWAILNAGKLDRAIIAEQARARWGLPKVAAMYQEWFDMLYDLWAEGWNTDKPRENLDWLKIPVASAAGSSNMPGGLVLSQEGLGHGKSSDDGRGNVSGSNAGSPKRARGNRKRATS